MRLRTSTVRFVIGARSVSSGLAIALLCAAAAPMPQVSGQPKRGGELASTVRVLDAQSRVVRPSRVVIDFDGPMSAARRAQLEPAGVVLRDYLGEGRWLAEAGPEAQRSAKGFPWVRSLAPWPDRGRLSATLGERALTDPARLARRAQGRLDAVISLAQGVAPAERDAVLQSIAAVGGKTFWTADIGGNSTIGADIPLTAAERLASDPAVLYIEEAPELTLRNDSVRWIIQSGVQGSTPVWSQGLTGAGEVFGIIDDPIDTAHCALADPVNPIGPLHRKVVAYNAPLPAPGTLGIDHGTHVAGICVGDAGSDGPTRGQAFAGKLVYSPIPAFAEGPMGAILNLHAAQGARIHTNSWGDENDITYSSLCRGVDAFAHANEDHLVVFAVTNENELRSPENAKSVLAVGASDDAPDIDDWCTGGIGPTADRRTKPEVYAPGCGVLSAAAGTECDVQPLSGTSMAAPAVAAAAGLARQYFREGFYPGGTASPGGSFTPSGALLRAAIVNSAVDLTGLSGYPGRREGYGRINLDRALHFAGEPRRLIVRDARHAQGLGTGDFIGVPFDLGAGSGEGGAAGVLAVTLAWTDPAPAPGVLNATVNNLDLELVSPSGVIYAGNHFASGFAAPLAASGLLDPRNTLEHIVVAPTDAEPGRWHARVKGAGVNVGSQGYGLVIAGDVAEPAEPPTGAAIAIVPTPAAVVAGAPTPITASLILGPGVSLTGGVALRARFAPGEPWMTLPMTPSAGRWTAALPPSLCAESPALYVEAHTSAGVVTDPPLGSAAPYTPVLALSTTVFTDDFEVDRAWSGSVPTDTATSGRWVRVDPIATFAQPADDHTPGFGTRCWVTGQGAPGGQVNTADVDGGTTTLLSPRFDLAGAGSATFSYWRWYDNSRSGPRDDTFLIQVSPDDGQSWTTAETVGPTGAGASGGWVFRSWDAAAFIPLTDRVRIRFVARDLGEDSAVEAAIDDFRLDRAGCADGTSASPQGACCVVAGACTILPLSICEARAGSFRGPATTCGPASPCCRADFNGAGGVSVQDIYDFLEAWLAADPRADFNGAGGVSVQDVYDFLEAWAAGC